VVVANVVGKYCGITYVFDVVPGNEWVEVSLREKMFSSTGVFVRLNADFKVIARYDYDSKTDGAFDKNGIPKTTIKYIPSDHMSGNFGTMGLHELDARTVDGSALYLNYDMSNLAFTMAGPPMNKDRGDLGGSATQTTLCYFKANEKDYSLKWKLNLKDKHIVAYRIYVFGNDLFLYTSYYTENSGQFITEQMIRKIDMNSGEVIYVTQLQAKPNFDLMLSNACYNIASKEFVFCGNYMSSLSDKEQRKTTWKLSSFFIAKIDAKGVYTTKDVDLIAEKPSEIKSEYLNEPFLTVKQLIQNQAGQYVAIGLYNYQLPSNYSYVTYGSNAGATDINVYKILVGGLSCVAFDHNLNNITQETNMITYTSKNVAFVGYFFYIPEVYNLGTKCADRFASVDSYWDSEDDCGVITYIDHTQKMGDRNASIYTLKIKSDKKEFFKIIGDIPTSDKTTFSSFLLDTNVFVYYITSQLGKNEFTAVDLKP
jgi:hypothetical protein